MNELSSLFAAVEKINRRLDKIETNRSQTPVITSEISHTWIKHPSLDKVNIAEAIADSLFGNRDKEKACTFEPDKPCDHCSMCNSRGF